MVHSRTTNLADITRRADILVCAAGRPKMVKGDMVKPGAVVIDVGIHRDENGKLCGDVDQLSVEPVAGALTPGAGRRRTDDDCHADRQYGARSRTPPGVRFCIKNANRQRLFLNNLCPNLDIVFEIARISTAYPLDLPIQTNCDCA